jgi:hypothetical protein
MVHISYPLRNSIVTVAGWMLMTVALAQTQSAPPQGDDSGDRPHGPPPEAISACQGKAAGAACSFTGRRGEQLTGTCFNPPSPTSNTQGQHSMIKRPMACRPPHRDNNPPGQ